MEENRTEYFEEAVSAMHELYGRDVAMSLATVSDGRPNIRMVNAYFKRDAFYIVSYALSNKVKELRLKPNAALNHLLFVAHGVGADLGHPLAESNLSLRAELKEVFSAFYGKHVNEQDKNTCILKISLTDALVFAHDYKYLVDFTHQTASRIPFVTDIIL